ncbi:B3 domain-containing transcription factor VRN1 [Linum grandiflorum]
MDSPSWGGPRFFKILVDKNLEASYMVIPKEFAKQHCEGLSNQIILKVPNGEAWPVELLKNEAKGLVWFGRGWQQFSQRYCFQHGHFLLFELLHNSNSFLVIIFNRTATEIDYSKQDWELAHTVLEMEVEQQQQQGLDIPHQQLPSLETTRMNIIMEKENSNGKTDVAGPTNKNKTPVSNVVSSSQRQRDSCSAATNINVVPSFSKVIKKAGCPGVPMRFVEMYVTKSSEKMVYLKVEGKSWAVKLKNFHQYNVSQLSKGWGQFARDNNLKEGDTCTFEMGSATNEFNVRVSRS